MSECHRTAWLVGLETTGSCLHCATTRSWQSWFAKSSAIFQSHRSLSFLLILISKFFLERGLSNWSVIHSLCSSSGTTVPWRNLLFWLLVSWLWYISLRIRIPYVFERLWRLKSANSLLIWCDTTLYPLVLMGASEYSTTPWNALVSKLYSLIGRT